MNEHESYLAALKAVLQDLSLYKVESVDLQEIARKSQQVIKSTGLVDVLNAYITITDLSRQEISFTQNLEHYYRVTREPPYAQEDMLNHIHPKCRLLYLLNSLSTYEVLQDNPEWLGRLVNGGVYRIRFVTLNEWTGSRLLVEQNTTSLIFEPAQGTLQAFLNFYYVLEEDLCDDGPPIPVSGRFFLNQRPFPEMDAAVQRRTAELFFRELNQARGERNHRSRFVFTPAELQLLQFMHQGITTRRALAERLGKSEQTVRGQFKRIIEKGKHWFPGSFKSAQEVVDYMHQVGLFTVVPQHFFG